MERIDVLNENQKRYVCIDLEMTEFVAGQSGVRGVHGEIIQFGAVMLDENFNMISQFSSYVKPVYSSVTPAIHELTGITNKVLENADDFITVLDKFTYWRGEGNITTFCWSSVDHKQLWNELSAKGKHRYDLFSVLNDFVDLQRIFVNLLGSKVAISLESALKLLNLKYEGQIHTALSDSYNTARILHKLFCTEDLDIEFDYINPKNHREEEKVENFNCSFASFMSPELLKQFGMAQTAEDTQELEDLEAETESDETNFNIELEAEEVVALLDDFALGEEVEKSEIARLCNKYRIGIYNWMNLVEKVWETEEIEMVG